jgi:2'-hydroxyisoflavone reductase
VAGSSAPPAGTSFVAADRDAEDGLATVASTRWDAVVVVSRRPGHVRRAPSATCAAGTGCSSPSGNVYADFSALEQDEDSALLAPLDGDVMESMEAYGPAKVACENATARGGPGCLGRHGRP